MFNDDEHKNGERATACGVGLIIFLAVLGSCARAPKNINQDKKSERAPVKIEHRENLTTNQLYNVRQSGLLHTR